MVIIISIFINELCRFNRFIHHIDLTNYFLNQINMYEKICVCLEILAILW